MVKYDPYVKRYITLEDYIKECYGGLPNESMLEEQWNALPDHPEPMDDAVFFMKLWVDDESVPYLLREAIKKL